LSGFRSRSEKGWYGCYNRLIAQKARNYCVRTDRLAVRRQGTLSLKEEKKKIESEINCQFLSTLYMYIKANNGPGSSVGIATDYGLDGP